MSKTKSLTWYEVLPAIIQAGLTRVLLYGPPDTGKTTTASLVRPDKPVFRVQCSRQQGIEDILGSYVLSAGGPSPVDGGQSYRAPITEFVPGPIAQAMTQGATLVLDEFDFRNPAHDSIWHAVLDDPKIAEVRLPDGKVIKPAPGFCVIATTNATPSAFSPALQRRFELKLFCGTSHPEALKAIAGPLASLVSNWQKSIVIPQVKVEMTVSSLMVYQRLNAHYKDQTLAAKLVFANSAEEFLSALANNMTA